MWRAQNLLSHFRLWLLHFKNSWVAMTFQDVMVVLSGSRCNVRAGHLGPCQAVGQLAAGGWSNGGCNQAALSPPCPPSQHESSSKNPGRANRVLSLFPCKADTHTAALGTRRPLPSSCFEKLKELETIADKAVISNDRLVVYMFLIRSWQDSANVA